MNAPTILTDTAPADPERRFLAACDVVLDKLRTPLRRYEKVNAYCTSDKMLRDFMKMERAADAMSVDRALHKEFVRAVPTAHGSFGKVFDFDAAERGRIMSARIVKFRKQLLAKMEADDEAFLAEPEDHFATPRVTSGMGGA